MNTRAKITIGILVILVVFTGIYAFIKAKEADKLVKMVVEEQQSAISARNKAEELSHAAARSASEAREAAAMCESLKQELDECKKRK